MDIRNIGNQGNVDRPGERTESAKASRKEPTVLIPRDAAQISVASRAVAASLDLLTEQARQDDPAREAIIEAAMAKLESGELDSDATLRATARALVDRDFLSA